MTSTMLTDVFKEIESEEQVDEYFNYFSSKYQENKKIIDIIKESFRTSYKSINAPFNFLISIEKILPNYLGNQGTRYIVHILRNGLTNKDQIMDLELKTKLQLLVQEYGIPYICYEKYIQNPLDYTTLQLAMNGVSDKNSLRIIRSDMQTLDLNLDLSTMVLFTQHMIEKINSVIEIRGNSQIDENLKNDFLLSVFYFLKLCGAINEHESD